MRSASPDGGTTSDSMLSCVAWREWRRNPSFDTQCHFRAARNLFHRTVRKQRKKFWSSWWRQLDELQVRCPRAAANQVRRKFRHKKGRLAHSLSPEHCASTAQERSCMDKWRHYFLHSALLDSSPFSARHLARVRRRTRRIRCTRFQFDGHFRPFTLCELDRALRNSCDNIP